MKQLAIGLAIVIACTVIGLHVLEDPPPAGGSSPTIAWQAKDRSSWSQAATSWLRERRSSLRRYRRNARADSGRRTAGQNAGLGPPP